MENKNTSNRELENLLRNGLEQVNESPDNDLWDKIEARQQPQNLGLRIRHIARYMMPMAAAVALLLAGWWYFDQTNPAPQPDTPLAQTEKPASVAPEDDEDAPEAPGLLVLPKTNPAQTVSGTGTNTVPASAVRFRAETGMEYQSPTTGTSVHIPANGLVDARGRIVRGEVELTLREYRNIPDFLASGIPMHYADERGSFFFNSGGMFEVRVSQNGEPLSMAPGQSYDLVFPATGQLTEASLFYLNDQTGDWEYVPDPVFNSMSEHRRESHLRVVGSDEPSVYPGIQKNRPTPALPPIVSEDEAIRNNQRRENLPCTPRQWEMPSKFDPAVWVKTAVRTGHELATGKTKIPGWFRKNPWIRNETLLNSVEHGEVRIVRNRDMGELFFPEDVSNTFTELRAFKDCYFRRTNDVANSDRMDYTKEVKELPTDVYWDRIVIAQEEGSKCQIWLYSDKQGLLQMQANLLPSMGNKNFDLEQVLADYKALRTQRLNDLETRLENLRKFLAVAIAFQSQDEWCMHHQGWLEYFETQRPLMAKRYGELVQAGLATNDSLARAAWANWNARKREILFNTPTAAATTGAEGRENLQFALRLTNFGTYNCDQIMRLGQPGDFIYASYQTTEGKRVYPTSVSIMERNTRLFFTLPENNKMITIPGRGLDIVVTDREGRQYHYPSEAYAQVDWNNKKSNTFTVKDVTDITRTPKAWAEYLEM
ncbi:MAG: hypothetical protein JNJ90_17850 [Saprospiraceae bacterium]|nr:hypothetical protein [Saprospiraceae bacterium]